MKRVNTRGIKLANKHVLMATLTYNLKKYMKFIAKRAYVQAIGLSKYNLKNFFSKNRLIKTNCLILSNFILGLLFLDYGIISSKLKLR
jgi:hypothetical protein